MHNPNMNVLLVLATLLSVFSHGARALPSDSEQDMTIISDQAEIDRRQGSIVYLGNVVLTQGTLTIEADRLVILQQDGVVQSARAEGTPARYQQLIEMDASPTQATGQRIDYQALKRLITVSGNAELQQQGNVFSGARIVYDISSETVSADSDIQDPKASTITPNSTPPQRIKVIIKPASVTTEKAVNSTASESVEKDSVSTGKQASEAGPKPRPEQLSVQQPVQRPEQKEISPR